MASTTFLHLSVLSAFLRKEYATIIYGRNTPYDYICVWLLCERCREDYMVMRYYCFVFSKDQGPTGFEEETVTWKGVSQARAPETRESNPGALVGCFSWAYPWSQSYLEIWFPLEVVPIELDLGWRVRKPKRRNRKVVGMLWYSEGTSLPWMWARCTPRGYAHLGEDSSSVIYQWLILGKSPWVLLFHLWSMNNTIFLVWLMWKLSEIAPEDGKLPEWSHRVLVPILPSLSHSLHFPCSCCRCTWVFYQDQLRKEALVNAWPRILEWEHAIPGGGHGNQKLRTLRGRALVKGGVREDQYSSSQPSF